MAISCRCRISPLFQLLRLWRGRLPRSQLAFFSALRPRPDGLRPQRYRLAPDYQTRGQSVPENAVRRTGAGRRNMSAAIHTASASCNRIAISRMAGLASSGRLSCGGQRKARRTGCSEFIRRFLIHVCTGGTSPDPVLLLVAMQNADKLARLFANFSKNVEAGAGR